jgi:hypothetical protein
MTIKGKVNRKWVSTDKYKDGFDRIFGKKEESEDESNSSDLGCDVSDVNVRLPENTGMSGDSKGVL